MNRAYASRGAVRSLLVVLGLCGCLVSGAPAALAVTLPDGRAYEMVTPLEKNGLEVGAGIPSISGNALNWEAPGACCGATSAAQTLYQSTRTGVGWQTKAVTPTPSRPLFGVTEEQAPVFWTGDLSQTIFQTPASYAAGDERPQGSGALDLYLQGSSGSPAWLSQGPFSGSGSVPNTATFDDATADAAHVIFSSAAQLTPEATGLSTERNEPVQYLYERNVAEGTTKLINVVNTTLAVAATEGETSIAVASTANLAPGQSIRIDTGASEETVTVAEVVDATHLALSAGLAHSHAAGAAIAALVSAEGAILGNGSYIGHAFLPADATGTTTNAVSSDGSKVFFESPTPGVTSTNATVKPHLYMRNESDGTTTALDDPASSGTAHYEGAAQDGSLVFFSSSEALGGEPLLPLLPVGGATYNAGLGPGDNELYEFNTTDRQIGPAPPMTAVPVSGGNLSFSTSLAAEAHGKVGTTAKGGIGTSDGETEFAATEGATSIPVVSSVGFLPGEKIQVSSEDTGSSNGEECPRPPGAEIYENFDVTITGASDATHLALAEPLPPGYCVYSRAPVTYEGDTSLVLSTTAGFVPGEILEVEGEKVTVESITDATHVALRSPILVTHPAGATVVAAKIQDGNVIGVTAISNDGSHVYFVAENILAENLGSQGKRAVLRKPNLYVFDTASGQTTFITTLASPDVNDCLPNCSQENPYADGAGVTFFGVQGDSDGLVAEPDVARPAVPTPSGSALVFDSSGDLTGQDPGPATTLNPEAQMGDRTLAVASTKGFAVGHTITIGTGVGEELQVIESIPDATHLALTETGPAGLTGLINKHAAGTAVTELHSELYRYEASNNSLTCVSCTPSGVMPTGSATLGAAGGGSYGPPMTAVPMNESGSEIFFQTPDPLVPEDVNGGSFANGPFGSTAESMDVYEWHEGKVSLISDGTSPTGAFLDGTTPSGNDVFITTREQLVSGDSDGYADIYDARVGGGLPQPSGPAKPCTGSGCRQANGASVFFSVPASATVTGAGTGNLTPPSVVAPSFTVGSISAAQRAASARSGMLALKVSTTAAGRVTAVVFASLHGKRVKVGTASVTLGRAGKNTLTLHLDKAARRALAKQGRLALRIEVSYSGSGTAKVATLTLSTRRAKSAASAGKAGARGAAVAVAHRGRVRGA